MNLSTLEIIAILFIAGSIILAMARFIIGPSTPDRVVAADTLSVITTAVLVWIASLFENNIYLDIALVYGALSFVGVVAIAKAMEGNQS